MENFEYCTPTKLVFGKGVIERLPGLLKNLGKKILLTYGGGSIKKQGLYDKVKELLADFEVYELSGIEPNPKYSSVLEGVKICKEKNIDAILAVGGGSVLDCSKAIAGAAKYDGEPWDVITHKVPTVSALPVADVMTLSATGSEYDAGCVISRPETNDKLAYMDPHLYPVFSILDPTYTFTVSPRQTAAGTADAINHVMEFYFAEPATLLTDGMSEAAIRSLMHNVKIALKNPEDYEARGEIMVDCALACNGIFAIGCGDSGWPCHAIEHALSAYYDITHGVGLAIITPRWMKHILSERTMNRFVKFGVNVFGIDSTLPEKEIAEKTIEETYRFFESIGLPMHLRDVGIDEKRIDEMAHHITVNEGLDKAYAPLSETDIKEILIDSL